MATQKTAKASHSALSPRRRKELRALGHALNPIVTLAGKGLTESVMAELQRALDDHELIKVKLVLDDRDARRQLTTTIEAETRACCVQAIGKVILLYRKSPTETKKSNVTRLTPS